MISNLSELNNSVIQMNDIDKNYGRGLKKKKRNSIVVEKEKKVVPPRPFLSRKEKLKDENHRPGGEKTYIYVA